MLLHVFQELVAIIQIFSFTMEYLVYTTDLVVTIIFNKTPFNQNFSHI